MKLTDILTCVTTCETIGRTDREITGIQMDSRLIESGDLFVAVKGTQTDGHAYIQKAIEKERQPSSANSSPIYARRISPISAYQIQKMRWASWPLLFMATRLPNLTW